ncbi:GH12 family glycosyl hydrolase domain-containing protein [Dactylosporangium sp. McL0621]|uniref:GH12 family glycosyl hydrolase domain-containing protein n=1 Tax=Dactylosporangium sp. McL0621 TaxID=3415678 RepID=UPI003CED5B61
MSRTLRAVAAAGLFVVGGLVAVMGPASPAGADTQICEQYGSTTIGGKYVVMNNNWGNSATQCINVTSTGFAISQINANKPTNGAPASYPAIYVGCHYTNCSPGTNLPMQISAISSAQTSISYNFINGATYDAAYDIWLDPTAKKDGVNATEIMIWFNRQGSIQPVGSQVGSASVAGRSWAVWQGNNGGNDVVSYVAPSAMSSWNFDVKAFINDVISRGKATTAWYLTSIQAGFEPWIGGQGLAVTAFSATINGGGGTTPPPGGGTSGCTATYRTINSWSGGFQGEVTVRNSGTAAISGWNTVWSGGSVSISSLWNGRVTSTSPVTVRNETYNGSLGASASTTYGFTASGSAPTSVSCATA